MGEYYLLTLKFFSFSWQVAFRPSAMISNIQICKNHTSIKKNWVFSHFTYYIFVFFAVIVIHSGWSSYSWQLDCLETNGAASFTAILTFFGPAFK